MYYYIRIRLYITESMYIYTYLYQLYIILYKYRILTNLEMKLCSTGLQSIRPKEGDKQLIYTNNYVNFENIDGHIYC